MRGKAVSTALIGLAFGLSSGCGYTFGFQGRADIRTLAIPMFENNTFRRGLEIELTKLVTREVMRRTPYRLTSAGGADAVLEGELRDAEERIDMEETKDGAAASGFAPDTILAGEATITCRFRLVSADGRVLAGPFEESRSAEHVRTRNQTDASAVDEALADLAERIVLYLEGW